MPTLVDLDSFQHQVIEVFNAGAGQWYLVPSAQGSPPAHSYTDLTFDAANARTADHAVALKVHHNTTRASQVRRTFAGGAVMVVSFYFKSADATNPTGTIANFFVLGAPTNGFIGLDSSGHVTARVGSGTIQTSATDYCDGQWHRVDVRYDRTTTSGTLDWQIDGNAETQATGTVTTGNATDWNISGTVAQGGDVDIFYSDVVVSNTSGDYPIGDHICKLLAINGKGTHSLGSGAFQDEGGSTTDDFETSVDDAWDGTTPNLTQTGEDYVQQTANDANAYVEFTVADPDSGDTDIWGARLLALMAGEDSATAATCEAKLVDSGGTTMATTGVNTDPTGSSTMYNGYMVPATTSPGGDGWTNSELAAVKIRFGFSADAAPDVIFNAGAVEYAAAWSAGQTVTGVALSATPSLPVGALAHTITGTALSATPSLPTGTVSGSVEVTGVALSATPSLPAGALAHTITGTALSATPSLPAGALSHTITGVSLSATPTLPAAALTHTITGTALSATPTLPVGAISAGAIQITGVALDATPTLPVGALAHSLTGVALSATPTLPVGTLQHGLTGTAFTITPTLPTATVTRSIAGQAFTITPFLPVGTVAISSLLGVPLEMTPTLPIGEFQMTGIEPIPYAIEHSQNTVIRRPTLRRGLPLR